MYNIIIIKWKNKIYINAKQIIINTINIILIIEIKDEKYFSAHLLYFNSLNKKFKYLKNRKRRQKIKIIMKKIYINFKKKFI